MKIINVLSMSVFLASCSSAPIFSLTPSDTSAQGPKQFIVDDTRYYKGRGPVNSYKAEDEFFSPSPKSILDAKLGDVLTGPDAEKVRLKMISVYLVYSRFEESTRWMKSMGMATGGIGGAGLYGAGAAIEANNNVVAEGDTDRQTVMCDFLARYKGRIVEFKISQPACSGQTRICTAPAPTTEEIFRAPDTRQSVEAVTQACITQAVARINAIKDLPAIAEADQEAR